MYRSLPLRLPLTERGTYNPGTSLYFNFEFVHKVKFITTLEIKYSITLCRYLFRNYETAYECSNEVIMFNKFTLKWYPPNEYSVKYNYWPKYTRMNRDFYITNLVMKRMMNGNGF